MWRYSSQHTGCLCPTLMKVGGGDTVQCHGGKAASTWWCGGCQPANLPAVAPFGALGAVCGCAAEQSNLSSCSARTQPLHTHSRTHRCLASHATHRDSHLLVGRRPV